MKVGDVVIAKQGVRDETLDWDVSGYRFLVKAIYGDCVTVTPVTWPDDYAAACAAERFTQNTPMDYYMSDFTPLEPPAGVWVRTADRFPERYKAVPVFVLGRIYEAIYDGKRWDSQTFDISVFPNIVWWLDVTLPPDLDNE